jgi:RND family efflux transporter MFP subunit
MSQHRPSAGLFASRVVVGVMVTLVLGASLACRAEEPVPEPVIRPVIYEEVYTSGGYRERSFSGVATASTEWNGSFKVSGTVETVLVEVGDSLQPGQLIAQLDAYDYELQVQQAEANLAQAQANSRNATATFERIRDLFESENATQTDYDSARAADESAREAVRSAGKTLELAQRRRDFTALNAPYGGDVAEVLVNENENVSSGEVVVVMTAGARPEVTLAIPEALIGDIRRGNPVSVAFDALPGRTFAATVTEVGVAATGMATTFPVTARLEEETPEVRSGMAADVMFRFGTGGGDAPILVPSAAVLEDRAGRFVYVLQSGEDGIGTAHRREVEVGEITNEGMEIRSGLAEGDLVITAGARRIVDGQQVKTGTGSSS